MATKDLVVTVTAAGQAAAVNNPPNKNGFNIQLGRAIVYDIAGVKRGDYKTSGYVMQDKTVRIAIIVGIDDLSDRFELARVDLIDTISGVVFARIHREDNTAIDSIYGKKKSFINYYLKLGVLDDDNTIKIEVSGDGQIEIAMRLLDEHMADKDAHSVPDSITQDTQNTTVGGEHTHFIEKASTTRKGIALMATIDMAKKGEDDDSFVTPAGLKAVIDALPQVANATTTTYGVVRLATANDIATGNKDAVVTADQLLNASGSVDIDLATIKYINTSTNKVEITFTPPFNCRKIAIGGSLTTGTIHVNYSCAYTFTFGTLKFIRNVNGSRSGGSGHGYYHNFLVPADMVIKAAESTLAATVNNEKVFKAGTPYTIKVTANDINAGFNISSASAITAMFIK